MTAQSIDMAAEPLNKHATVIQMRVDRDFGVPCRPGTPSPRQHMHRLEARIKVCLQGTAPIA